MMESIQQFDVELFLKIHRGLSNGFFDWLMPLMRNRFFWSPLYLFIVVFCIKQYKKQGYYIIGMVLFTFAMGDLIASRVVKPLVSRVRPCNDLSLANDIIHRVPCGSGLSFPSAHATNHFAIAVFLICLFYSRWKPILPIGIFWAFIISFAQVYVGVHYPVDVTIGALLGITIGIICSRIFKKLQPDF
ncbi:membrane-associated phospholipid phosphatase [Pedobacter sp. W3I1]|uniref:phosphatase PAP2 family protein n=1 Tax=Pedobacter sp. W3I1 TaxID=3042291 RepID=UPI0027857128|nr:phosphatase PAP2 family protein [Pedobacter sp. W3I1]MDQ0638503.1 membrane-associated phospholipid phosphatase [Pedobacter sp. W3I1]